MRSQVFKYLILGSAIFLILIPYVGDNDLWFHLRIGEVMVEDGVFPRTDTFSFTAFGEPFVNPEWLSQAIFFGTVHWAGFTVLALLVALAGLVFLILSIGRKGIHSWALVAIVIAATYALQPFFVPRPQIFVYIVVAAFWILIRAYLKNPSPRLFAGVLAAAWVWGNIHAAVIIMLVIFGCIVLSELVRPALSRRFPILALMVGSVLISLVNPFGIKVYTFAFQPLRYRETYHSLIETRPIFEHLSQNPILIGFLLHLFFGFLVIWFLAREKERARLSLLEYLVLFIVFFAPFFSIKYLPYAWAFMLPSLIGWANNTELFKKFTPVAIIIGVVFAGIVFSQKNNLRKDPHLEWPKEAVAFIDEEIKGNIYNPYSLGGYMMWQNKGRPIFIDGRFEMFVRPRDVFSDAEAFERGERVDEIIAEYDLSAVIARPWATLPYTLSMRSDWSLVYWDNFVTIYVKKDGLNNKVVKKYDMDIPFINDSIEGILRKAGLNKLPALIGEYEEAVRRHPDLLMGRFTLGMLYQAGGNCALALNQWSEILKIDKRLGGAHYKSAECYKTLGNQVRAAEEKKLGDRYSTKQKWWYGRP